MVAFNICTRVLQLFSTLFLNLSLTIIILFVLSSCLLVLSKWFLKYVFVSMSLFLTQSQSIYFLYHLYFQVYTVLPLFLLYLLRRLYWYHLLKLTHLKLLSDLLGSSDFHRLYHFIVIYLCCRHISLYDYGIVWLCFYFKYNDPFTTLYISCDS